jgi:hypothetical protein
MGVVRNDHPSLAFGPFWAALPEGKRATIVDVPYVPAVERDGFRTMTGWGVHDEVAPRAYPEAFGHEVRSRFGRHPLEVDTRRAVHNAAEAPHDP